MAGITGRFDADFQPFLKAVEQANTSLEKLEGHTKDVNTSMDALLGTLNEVAGAFGIAFSVSAVVNFGKELFADAQALDTLSKQTRTSIGDLQILTGATEAYGISAEDIGRALFTLRERIAGGDQSVTRAYARMGISMDEVRAKQTDAIGLLSLTERGLASVGSEMQDLSAKDLFPAKLAAGMLGVANGFDDLVAKSRAANQGVSEATKVMAEYADAIDRAERSLKNVATQAIGAPLAALDALNKATKENVSWWKLLEAAAADFALNQNLTGFTAIANGLAKINAGQKDIVLTTEKATDAQKQHADAIAYMARIQGESAKPLLEYQAVYLDQLRTMGLLDAQHAKDIGVTAEQFQQYKADLEAVTKADQDLAKAQQEQNRIAMDAYSQQIKILEALTAAHLKAYGEDEQIAQLEALRKKEVDLANAIYAELTSEKDRMKLREDLAVKLNAIDVQEEAIQQKKLQRTNANVVAELDAQARVLASYGQNVDGTVKMENAQYRLQERLDALHRTKSDGIDLYYREIEIMNQFQKEQDEETEKTDKLTEAKKKKNKVSEEEIQLTAAQQRALDAMSSFSLTGAAPVDPKFANMSTEAKRLAGYIDLYGKITPLGQSVGLGYSAGGRAAGGPVSAGTPYMVGERGPELFVPAQSGSIVPNGGGTTVTAHIYVNGTAADVARQVAAELLRTIKSGTQLAGA